MNKEMIFWYILIEKITNKNYKKFKLTKSSFYKIYSRVRFYHKITDPIKLMILNLSEREFHAVTEGMPKDQFFAKSKSKSFSHIPQKLSKNPDETV